MFKFIVLCWSMFKKKDCVEEDSCYDLSWCYCLDTKTDNSHKGAKYLCSFTKPKIIRQIPFELTDIEYDKIKYET